METAHWQIIFDRVPRSAVDPLELAFEDCSLGTASFEAEPTGTWWTVSALLEAPLDEADLARRLNAVENLPAPRQEPLDLSRDWVSEVQASFKPLSIGSFLVLGSHHQNIDTTAKTVIQLDAGAAFGTGEHATTQGCLMAMEEIVHRNKITHALDMGCGSGILAIALAKHRHIPVLGVEIDPVAVAVARENVLRNRIRSLCRIECGNGYRLPLVGKHGPYPLIIANILAAPLVEFAPALARHLAPGGYAILSGLLNTQANWVSAAHRVHNLTLTRHIRIGEWSTLVLKKS